jgi:hypothetical protein
MQIETSGAGEGIRTLDPNLGKVSYARIARVSAAICFRNYCDWDD